MTVDFRVESGELPLAAVSFGAAFRAPEGALGSRGKRGPGFRWGAGRRGYGLSMGERG